MDKPCFQQILKIYLEEKLVIKYCVIKNLILLKFQIKYGYQGCLATKDFTKSEIMPNQQLAEELHKSIIKRCETS